MDSKTGYQDLRRDDRSELIYETLSAISVLQQLLASRTSHLVGSDLPVPQFTMLNYFHRMRSELTVTELAHAFQAPQPGITKTVQKLLSKGYLSARSDVGDRRRKILQITDAGLEAHLNAVRKLAPDAIALFDGWTFEEMQTFNQQVDRLKGWVSDHRDAPPLSDQDA